MGECDQGYAKNLTSLLHQIKKKLICLVFPIIIDNWGRKDRK